MHDARDAEDKRLLEAGEFERLLENYVYLVREWTLVRLRDREAADEVSQRVFLRLLRELRAGKQYVVPFRVVVWKVVDFTCRGYEWGTRHDGALPTDEWDPEAPNALAAWEDEYDVAKMLADLPERQREVLELVYLEGLGPQQVAARLGVKRNAVDQALHNGHRKLAERLGG
jgi:RNA polymerase sigma-70 factor (ECF subfamily)